MGSSCNSIHVRLRQSESFVFRFRFRSIRVRSHGSRSKNAHTGWSWSRSRRSRVASFASFASFASRQISIATFGFDRLHRFVRSFVRRHTPPPTGRTDRRSDGRRSSVRRSRVRARKKPKKSNRTVSHGGVLVPTGHGEGFVGRRVERVRVRNDGDAGMANEHGGAVRGCDGVWFFFFFFGFSSARNRRARAWISDSWTTSAVQSSQRALSFGFG